MTKATRFQTETEVTQDAVWTALGQPDYQWWLRTEHDGMARMIQEMQRQEWAANIDIDSGVSGEFTCQFWTPGGLGFRATADTMWNAVLKAAAKALDVA